MCRKTIISPSLLASIIYFDFFDFFLIRIRSFYTPQSFFIHTYIKPVVHYKMYRYSLDAFQN